MKTVRRPPYPKWNPGYFPCSSLTPLPLSSRRPSVSFGGFGLKTGFNLVSLPVVTPGGGYTTRTLTEAIIGIPAASDAQVQAGSVISILGWDSGSQIYNTWAAAVPSSDISSILANDGYFIRVNQDVTVNP